MALDMSNIFWSIRSRPGTPTNINARGGPDSVKPSAAIYGLKKSELTLTGKTTKSRGIRNREPALTSGQIGTTKDGDIPFQYIEQIPTWSKAANYTEISDIAGRYESLSVYSNSQAQDLSLTLIYHVETETGTWSMSFIEQLKNRLRACVFPEYGDSPGNKRYGAPPILLLNIGSIYTNFPVIMRNISIDESTGPFDPNDGLKPHIKKITLELKSTFPIYQKISHNDVWRSSNGTIFSQRGYN